MNGEESDREDRGTRLSPQSEETLPPLTLRWPAIVTDTPDPDLYVLDVVNIGSGRFVPDAKDSFHVIGTVVPAGSAMTGIGWAVVGQPRALPLDPGEYARLPVMIGSGAWRALAPGAHDVHAVLVGTALRAPVLRVELSADRLRRRRAEGVKPDPERRRRLLDEEIARLSAVLEVGPVLAAFIREIAEIPTETEAVEVIARRLAVDETLARSIFATPLRDLHASSSDRLRDSITRSLQHRDLRQ